jgi:hypothetical protein
VKTGQLQQKYVDAERSLLAWDILKDIARLIVFWPGSSSDVLTHGSTMGLIDEAQLTDSTTSRQTSNTTIIRNHQPPDVSMMFRIFFLLLAGSSAFSVNSRRAFVEQAAIGGAAWLVQSSVAGAYDRDVGGENRSAEQAAYNIQVRTLCDDSLFASFCLLICSQFANSKLFVLHWHF